MKHAESLTLLLSPASPPAKNAHSASPTSSPRARTTQAPLAQFKAGKCDFAKKEGGPTLVVTPSPRKGQIQVVRDESDMLHFQWKDRTAGSVVDDVLVFAGDCTFEKIETGVEADRVYMLQFKAQKERRWFYWMQDKMDAEDEANVKKVVAALDGTAEAGGAGAGGANEHQEALMRMLMGGGSPAGAAAASPPAAAAAPAAGSPAPAPAAAVQLTDLQGILAGMNIPQAASTPAAAAAPAAAPTEAGVITPPATVPAAAPAGGAAAEAAPAPAGLAVGDLQSILANMGAANTDAAAPAGEPPAADGDGKEDGGEGGN